MSLLHQSMKSDEIYADLAEDVKKVDTFNYQFKTPSPVGRKMINDILLKLLSVCNLYDRDICEYMCDLRCFGLNKYGLVMSTKKIFNSLH